MSGGTRRLPRRIPCARNWIAGGQGLVLLGIQLLPSEAEAMLREAQSRTGRKALMAVVLAPTPEQFNGTAVLQKHSVKVYTSQQQVLAAIPAAHAEALRRLGAQFGKDYPAAEPKPASYGEASRQMLIGGAQFQLRTLGPGPGVAHVAVDYDGQLFAGNLVAGPVHPVLYAGGVSGLCRAGTPGRAGGCGMAAPGGHRQELRFE